MEEKKLKLIELKKLNYIDLINEFQIKDNNVILRFRNFEIESKNKKPKELLSKANTLLYEFTDFYEAFFHKYNLFVQEIHNIKSGSNRQDVESARSFFELCNVHITRINTSYIQPLTNEITIKKANASICWGIISVLIGLIATAISVYFSIKPNDNILQINNDIKCQTIILKNMQKEYTTLDSITKLNKNIQPVIKKK